MPADASVFGMFKPAPAAEGPLDQYGKVLNLKHLMGQGKLQDLQTQQAEQSMQENQDFKSGLASIGPSGETPEAKANRLTAIAPKLGFEYQKNQREANKDQASIDHTKAQTAEIKAGDIAGNWATLTQGGSSDEAVKQVHDTMLQKGMPEAQAQAVTQQLLSLPPEKRIPWMTAMAAQHKTGQEALKLFFPPAHMQDTGGSVTPVSTSTMPGAPTPGTPIPGGVPLQKTQSPDSAAVDARARQTLAETTRHHGVIESQSGNFDAKSSELLGALAEKGVSIPAGFRSRAQISATLKSLVDRNPEKSSDQIADMLKSGQISFGAEKKETQTAAAVSGRVAVAGEEITQFAPLVEQSSASVPRGKFVPISKLMQTSDTAISDPALKTLKVNINAMMNAYDLLASRGGTDKDKRAEAHSLLTSAESHEALMAGVKAFQKEVVAAQRAADIASLPRSERDAARAGGAKAVPKGDISPQVKALLEKYGG